jgi:hypothetical protein
LPDGVLAKAEAVIDAHNASFAAAVAAGVKIAMGTDSGVGPHGSNLRELTLMAAGGMTARDVLVATTSSAAELLGVDTDLGTLTPASSRTSSSSPGTHSILPTSRTTSARCTPAAGWCAASPENWPSARCRTTRGSKDRTHRTRHPAGAPGGR